MKLLQGFAIFACWLAQSGAAATLSLELKDQAGNAVDDAILYVVSIDGRRQAPEPGNVEVDQVNETFVPHVRAAAVGSLVNFPNSDHVRHHVYSFSEAKTFDVPLYSGVPEEPILLDKPGLVTLGCNIHDHMLGYILVLDTAWFAEVRNGTATIADLPGGRLEIEIWHPRLAIGHSLAQSLALEATEAATIEAQIQLLPERTIRRAPRRGSSRY